MPVEGLDRPCTSCGRVSGDHTVREWAACLGEVARDDPYMPTGTSEARRVAAELNQRFGLEDDWIVADHVQTFAALLDGSAGAVGVKLPAVIHDFQVGVGGVPRTVAKVVFIAGKQDAMRRYGRLIRDSANGAANAAVRQGFG